jgi:hypothetical protein
VQHRLIDAFPQFTQFWEQVKHKSLDEQIELWADEYMSQWPELMNKQTSDYQDQGVDWRQIARERIFPFLPERLDGMKQAHRGLQSCIGPIYDRARATLGLDFDIVFVIYVGIGCGAGWATTLEGTPACLFGLENVVEYGWTERDALAALTAHEVGHLLHFEWRKRKVIELCKGPMWQLYEEGFAQRCEHITMALDTWHQQVGQEGWTEWCSRNLGELAAHFLELVDAGEPVTPFFGSWYDVQGWRQCGYYLGHEIVSEWMAEDGIERVALLPCDVLQRRVREELERLVS